MYLYDYAINSCICLVQSSANLLFIAIFSDETFSFRR